MAYLTEIIVTKIQFFSILDSSVLEYYVCYRISNAMALTGLFFNPIIPKQAL